VTRRPPAPWLPDYWDELDSQTRRRALSTASDAAAWRVVVREARGVLRSFSTSFFIVTRFLPPAKRAKVEAIYAAVRYPDEIVDSFALPPREKRALLEAWATHYEAALAIPSMKTALAVGVPCFVASFTAVVREARIPPEHYRSFLGAMRHDLNPRRFATLDDLIDSYIYGSAIVVGYFLAHVYGPASERDFDRALQCARNLAVALQLTNFLRDVAEDQRRSRLYLPLDMLAAEGVTAADTTDPAQHPALNRVLQRLTDIADDYYARASADLDAFAADSRLAISACIDVYRQLNSQIRHSPRGILHRESVPMARKFRVLPPSKYWRLPLAYLTQ
jgi:15-cis-phytoene synthase